MPDFQDIEIIDFDVIADESTGTAELHFKLSTFPHPPWELLFYKQYRRHFSSSDQITLTHDCIVFRVSQDLISPDKKNKIYNDVASTNTAYRNVLEKKAREQAQAQENQRRQDERNQKKSEELKRKLLGNGE